MLFDQTDNLIYPYPVVNRSIALGSTTFDPTDDPSITATASALIHLNGDTGAITQAIPGTTTVGHTITANSLTSGKGLFIDSSATAFTGNLANITLSGSHADNTGSLLELDNTGTSNTNTTFYIKHYATGTNNLALRIDDVSSDTTPFVVDGTGQVGIQDSSPDYLLELSSAASSDPTFALSDGDITHGLTDLAQTDVVYHIAPLSSSAGGAQLTAITESDAQALSVRGVIGATNPTDTTPAIKLIGGKDDGSTGIADLLASESLTANTSETVFQVANNNNAAALTVMGNDNVGIGQVAPISKLTVTNNPADADHNTGKAAFLVDQYENQDLMTASASGVTKFKVESDADVVGERFVDLGNASGTYYIDPANGTTSIIVDGNIISNDTFSITSNATNGNITIDAGTGIIFLGGGAGAKQACVSTNGSTCTGKIDAGTVDPPYTIDGKHYATYMPSMTGVKEETTGTIATGEYVPGVGYRTIIDFTREPEGSDLWLFSRATDLTRTASQLVVLVSPQANTSTWYDYDAASRTLSIYTARPTTVSYRLTAPRFDWQTWGNIRKDDMDGFIVNYTNEWEASGETTTPEDWVASLVITPLPDGTYALKDTEGVLVAESAAYARALVANLQAGLVEGVQGVFGSVSTQSITSPVAQIDELETNVISPVTEGSGTVDVALSDTQSFGILNEENGERVATFDNEGNVDLSGDLTADDITLSGDASIAGALTSTSVDTEEASVSGTLYANNVVTEFGDLNSRFSSIEDSLDSVGSPSSSIVYVTPTPAPTIDPWNPEGTESASPVTYSDGNLTVNTDLFVLGDTLLSSTAITGSLLVDGMIRFAENVIETIGETLYIQKNKLANVDILNGTVIIDTLNRIFFNGSLAVSGNTTVAGTLGASTVMPFTNQDLTIDLGRSIPDLTASTSASPSAGFGDLVIRGRNNQVVASIDASGSAMFAGDITIQGATHLNGPLHVSQNSMGTSITVSPSATSITVSGFDLSQADYSMFVTPSWDTSTWVSEKASTSATIQFSSPAPDGATADWLLLLSSE